MNRRQSSGGLGDLQRRVAALPRLHLFTALSSLGRLWRAGPGGWMTVAVIAIALALPAVFLLALSNLQAATQRGQGLGELTIFFEVDAAPAVVDAVAAGLRDRPTVAAVQVMTADEALDEFKALSGFSDALNALDANPLPPVAIVRLHAEQMDADALAVFAQEIEQQAGVDFAQFDLAWIARLKAILGVAGRATEVLGALFALAVLLIVGNTIRLDITNRRDEIVITKLIGATDAFVRRPFLYSGLWYGLLGGLLAWLLVLVAVLVVAGPVQELAASYGESFDLKGPGLLAALQLIGLGAALGWLGSAIAVHRHLSAIEPR